MPIFQQIRKEKKSDKVGVDFYWECTVHLYKTEGVVYRYGHLLGNWKSNKRAFEKIDKIQKMKNQTAKHPNTNK